MTSSKASFLASIIIFPGVSLTIAPTIAADVINVPGDQPTIQAGINAALPGDQVLVAPGTYTGAGNKNLDFGGKNIAVVSAAGPMTTIIDAQGSGRAFHLHSGLDSSALVEGFTIRNGNASPYGGGILIDQASPTIRNCILTGNTATDEGGGIAVIDVDGGPPENPAIEHCTLTANAAPTGGGGIAVHGFITFPPAPEATITDCTIEANMDGGLRLSGGVRYVILRCTISENVGRGVVVAADGIEGASGRLEQCVIRANTGGGLHIAPGFSGVNCVDCQISDHTTITDGAGVEDISDEGQLRFEGCTFARNHSQTSGGGAAIKGIHGAAFINCRFEENSAVDGGGVYYQTIFGPLPVETVQACRFISNTATRFGGGMRISVEPIIRISNGLFWNNSAGQNGGAVSAYSRSLSIRNSTMVGNSAPQGAGVFAAFVGPVDLDRTIIAFSPSGPSVTCEGPFTPLGEVVCCDFFRNAGGDWTGCATDELGVNGNISADPQFCDAGAGDFTLSDTSPCAPMHSGGCDLIGAFPVSCGVTQVLESTRTGRTRLAVKPNPVCGLNTAKFSFELTPAAVEIYDLQGRLMQVLIPKDRQAVWVLDASVPRGIYFARLRGAAVPEVVKFAVVR